MYIFKFILFNLTNLKEFDEKSDYLILKNIL